MNYLNKILLLSGVAVLSACGGGGGSGGTSTQSYSIALRTVKANLPVNLQNGGPGIGAYAAYTTTLYVDAKTGGSAIPDGENIYSCNITQGLDSASLYYLDGKPEHEDSETKAPLAYRSITLGSNSGSASFHLHAGTKSGVVRVTCSVTNPRDQKSVSASVDVTVGGGTGMASSVQATPAAPGYVGSRDNTAGLRNVLAIEAEVFDDSNQPIPSPTAANVQVSIRPLGGAATGAKLLSGAQSGSVVQVATTAGVAHLTLAAGKEEGPILLEFVTDRADNNVANGIQTPMTSLKVIYAVHEAPTAAPSIEPLTLDTTAISATAVNGQAFGYVMQASGGVVPYTWKLLGTLPAGLSLSPDGLISGTPNIQATATYNFAVQVTDAAGTSKTANLSLVVTVPPLPVVVNPLTINVAGCSGDVNVACALPPAALGAQYQYAFSATGGSGSSDTAIAWGFAGLPTPIWLAPATTGAVGVITGTPTAAQCVGVVAGGFATQTFFVSATRGASSITRRMSIQVGPCP